MQPGSQILFDVPAGTVIRFEGCKLFGCTAMWKGIEVVSSSNTVAFVFTGCRIEDAFKALTLHETPTRACLITGNQFINNYIGITNRKQNGTAINANWWSNAFYANANLLPKYTGLTSTDVPDHPKAYAGIDLVRTSLNIGRDGNPSNNVYVNSFSCMINGIRADNCTMTNRNAFFLNLDTEFGTGIWVNDGTATITRCAFANTGFFGIDAKGNNLTVRNSFFTGSNFTGISSLDNRNGEIVLIERNLFDYGVSGNSMGVELERSVVNNPNVQVHNRVNDNRFELGGETGNFIAIRVIDFVNASTDQMQILRDTINVNDCIDEVVGIEVLMTRSEGFKIRDNRIHFDKTVLGVKNYGIYLVGKFPEGGTDHSVRFNRVTGSSPDYPGYCAIHGTSVDNVEYCDNFTDLVQWGVHFRGTNDVELRESDINNHEKGLFVGFNLATEGKAFIGEQIRRGNIWLNGTAYDEWATQCICENPVLSQFIIESSSLPLFPDPTKIDPPLTTVEWFKTQLGRLDYCQSTNSTTRSLSPFDVSVVDGSASLNPPLRWDLQRGLYLQLLRFPELVVPDSPEEEFLADSAETVFAQIARVEKDMLHASAISSEDMPVLDSIRTLRDSLLNDIFALDDTLTTVTELGHLDSLYLLAKQGILAQLSVLDSLETAIKLARASQMATDLQDVQDLNDAIAPTEPWEEDYKAINTALLKRLLGEPLTQTEYDTLASISAKTQLAAGNIPQYANQLLLPCDVLELARDDEYESYKAAPTDEQNTRANKLVVKPNPTNGVVEISLPTSVPAGTLSVYDVGQTSTPPDGTGWHPEPPAGFVRPSGRGVFHPVPPRSWRRNHRVQNLLEPLNKSCRLARPVVLPWGGPASLYLYEN